MSRKSKTISREVAAIVRSLVCMPDLNDRLDEMKRQVDLIAPYLSGDDSVDLQLEANLIDELQKLIKRMKRRVNHGNKH